jgi:DJ-1 family protein
MVTVLVPIADGTEEMEAVIVIDVLRRAKWKVDAVSLTDQTIVASRRVRLAPDIPWSQVDLDRYDILVLPGGAPGVEAMKADSRILNAVRSLLRNGKQVAAICAAPLILQAAGVLENRRFTSHPAVRPEFVTGRPWCSDRVVVDGNLVTSQGPGTAFEFALKLIEIHEGPQASSSVAGGLVL